MSRETANGMIPLFAAAMMAYERVFSTRRNRRRGGAMRFELGEGFAAVTQLAVNKADLERVLDELKSRPLEL